MKKQPDIISGKTWNNEQIPAIIDRLWNVCGQMGVERLRDSIACQWCGCEVAPILISSQPLGRAIHAVCLLVFPLELWIYMEEVYSVRARCFNLECK